MQLVIGTDEAGYGPNLGPLVVSGTAWLVNESLGKDVGADQQRTSLYEVFADCFVQVGAEPPGDRIAVGDSKKVYQSGGSLAGLESLVLPLAFADDFVADEPRSCTDTNWTWSRLIKTLSLDRLENRETELPWYSDFNPVLPIQSDPSSRWKPIPNATQRPEGAVRQLSRLIEPGEFNSGIERLGNKASLLSSQTLSIVRSLMDFALNEESFDIGKIVVLCDKHGGRSHYASIIQSVFADSWVHVIRELPERSCYELTYQDRKCVFEFHAKGESHLPIAAASMISKYLREISMRAFNEFWQTKCPGVRATAGYPQDAKRFRAEIESTALELGLSVQRWWREK